MRAAGHEGLPVKGHWTMAEGSPSWEANRQTAGRALATALAVAAAVVLYGGYGLHWRWIGINGATATLWDWLHLLLLPVAAVVLTLWLRHRPQVGAGVRVLVGLAAAVFLVLVIAGYLIPWRWTGFVGNTLWDWLNLAALPLAVVLIPVLVELRDRWGRVHVSAGAAALAAFVLVVIGGYVIPWAWTGFVGNTLWDWLHLLLLPLLVPLVIVPLVHPLALARMGVGDVADAGGGDTGAEVSGSGQEAGQPAA